MAGRVCWGRQERSRLTYITRTGNNGLRDDCPKKPLQETNKSLKIKSGQQFWTETKINVRVQDRWLKP